MITNFAIESFNLLEYELNLFQIDTYADPDYPDEGSMIIRVEGAYGKNSRLHLIAGVIPHARQETNTLTLGSDDIAECYRTFVKLKMESLPTNHKFVLVWESKTPYFVGVQSGQHYRF